MEEFIQKLTALFHESFPGSIPEYENAWEHRVGSLLVWEGFTGRPHLERQRMVWKMLRSKLTPDEQRQVAGVLTLTPEEMDVAKS